MGVKGQMWVGETAKSSIHDYMNLHMVLVAVFWSAQYVTRRQTLIFFPPYQYGVPTKELAGEAMEAEPKSASLTCPGSVSRMFPAFTSLRHRCSGDEKWEMCQSRERCGGQYASRQFLPGKYGSLTKTLTCGSYYGSAGRPAPAKHHV